jgi:hypothetical protein
LTYEGNPEKGMAYLKQVGSPQQAQQIMANLMQKASSFPSSETRLANNEEEVELSPAVKELKAQMEKARQDAAQRRRQRTQREQFELKQRLNRAFGPGVNGIEDQDINGLMRNLDQQHQDAINQLPRDNRVPITRYDGTNQNGQPLNRGNQNPPIRNQNVPNQNVPSQNQTGSPYVTMNDGRLGVVDPRTGLVIPLPDVQRPPQQNSNRIQPGINTPPNLMQLPNETRRVIPNQPMQLNQQQLNQQQLNQQRLNQQRLNQLQSNQLQIQQQNANQQNLRNRQQQFNPNRSANPVGAPVFNSNLPTQDQLNRTAPRPIGPLFPNGITQGNGGGNLSFNTGVANPNLANTNQGPGVWNAGTRTKTGVATPLSPSELEQAKLRAMQVGLAAGPGGFLPPNLSNPSQQTVRRPITPIGLPQLNNGQQQQNQGQQNGQRQLNGQPDQAASRQTLAPLQLQADPNRPGQRDVPSANNVWQPNPSQTIGPAAGAPVSAFDHSSTQGSLGPSNWITMPTSAPAQVASPSWNFNTQRPHQTSGHRTLTTPLSNEWRTGAMSSPTLAAGFGQPRVTHRDPSATQPKGGGAQGNGVQGGGAQATINMDLDQHRQLHNLNPNQSTRDVFQERFATQ